MNNRTTMRSLGVQARSRERVELLLSTAEVLIAETGIEGLKMRELARRASLPIASVYHYFPSVSSVVRALAMKHLSELRDQIVQAMSHLPTAPENKDDRAVVAAALVTDMARFLLQSPVSAIIWDSLRGNPELRVLDMKDTESNAQLLRVLTIWAVPTLPEDEVDPTTLVILEAIQGNLIRIMHSEPEDRETLVTTLERVVAATLRGLQ
ncbi:MULTISPECIES: TetR/AcrR family transcriptional regulator [Agrobacterium]|uniref:TetR/AcrR family transcriptional regulator n=1 Tax=Agrobacterium tumefaciens TaxID=358 RepID=UPI00157310D5|nr:TetR/AcrR family transcriptional regulator [Agrobacterium tumefaciens]NSZ09386.1 TetR/AcrR family transcriptional regulator [Agrobacterium tumefaciens]